MNIFITKVSDFDCHLHANPTWSTNYLSRNMKQRPTPQRKYRHWSFHNPTSQLPIQKYNRDLLPPILDTLIDYLDLAIESQLHHFFNVISERFFSLNAGQKCVFEPRPPIDAEGVEMGRERGPVEGTGEGG
jgi:hypothetical protein